MILRDVIGCIMVHSSVMKVCIDNAIQSVKRPRAQILVVSDVRAETRYVSGCF